MITQLSLSIEIYFKDYTGTVAGDESQTAEMRSEPMSVELPWRNRGFDALAQIHIRALKELST